MCFEDIQLNGIAGVNEPVFGSGAENYPFALTLRTATLSATVTSVRTGADKLLAVLEELETLLREGDAACLNLIRELRAVSGSEELIHELEQFYFGCALVILGELKREIEKRTRYGQPEKKPRLNRR